MIYLDNAATTLKKPEEVKESLIYALEHLGNASRGAHNSSLDASRIIYDTRIRLAKLFNINKPSTIAFTMNATHALNIAIKGLFKKGDHIITTVLEHNSVLRPLNEIKQLGIEVSYLTCDEKGNINIEDIHKHIKTNTKAVICTHASNVTGNIVDITKIGQYTRQNNILLIVDASQSAGVIDIDVNKMNIDILCFTGHKSLLGPQGVGGLYVREGIDIRPLMSGGSGIETYNEYHPSHMPTLLEAGTLNAHGIAGLNGALRYIERYGIENIRNKELELMFYMFNEIKHIKDIKIYGDFLTKERCPILAINIKDYDSSYISDILYYQYKISVRGGGHCAPLMHKALKTDEQGVIRFSFSHFNTLEEVKEVIKILKELCGEHEYENHRC